MKVDTNKIPKEGLDISETYEPKSLDLDREDIKFVSPIKVSAHFIKSAHNLFVEVEVISPMILTCGRCLTDFESELSRKFSLNYQFESETTLDITGDIREEIISGYPMKLLCRKDCKGLCPFCGQNLNEGECDCKR